MDQENQRQRGWGKMAAWGVLCACATAGCKPAPCGGPPSPCPPYFDVVDWCANNGGCDLEHPGGKSCLGECGLPPGNTLDIPIARFAAELAARHQLGIAVVGGSGTGELRDLSISLDGQNGFSLPKLPGGFLGANGAEFDFSPFPAAPMVLKIANSASGSGYLLLWLFFMDYACQQANPAVDCPL